MLVFFGIVAAVAERFILGLPATTKSNSVANLICFSVCGFNRYATAHP